MRLEKRAVNIVRSRPGGQDDGSRPIHLCRRIAGFGAELRNRIQARGPRRNRLPLPVFQHRAILQEFEAVTDAEDPQSSALCPTCSVSSPFQTSIPAASTVI
jgi:hypothetical protein